MMLLECHYIDEEGGIAEIEPKSVKLTQKTCAIIVSHDNRCIYLFKGNEVSIVQKFQSARTGSQMRLQQGYKIKHIEDLDSGIAEDFAPIMDFLGGLQGADTGIKENTSVTQPTSSETRPKPMPPKTLPANTTPPKADSPMIEQSKTTAKLTKIEADPKLIPENLDPKLKKVVLAMMEQDPPQGSQCDYILIGNKLYILVGGYKADLRKGGFNLEEVTTLPEGIFSVENYFPRILVTKKKILGVELWARR
ncbi:MAG TPA: hypothetical protein VMX55_12120 [candidate division Zixibacteria bacterium]|nr:hypothetical protein [candidate division Zixibacteria bacterium]